MGMSAHDVMWRLLQEQLTVIEKRVEKLETAEPNADLPLVAFADLPAAAVRGRKYFLTDGLKNGETTGNGTGCEIVDDGTDWYRTSDYTVASN